MTIYYVPDDFQLPNYLLSQVKGKSKRVSLENHQIRALSMLHHTKNLSLGDKK